MPEEKKNKLKVFLENLLKPSPEANPDRKNILSQAELSDQVDQYGKQKK